MNWSNAKCEQQKLQQQQQRKKKTMKNCAFDRKRFTLKLMAPKRKESKLSMMLMSTFFNRLFLFPDFIFFFFRRFCRSLRFRHSFSKFRPSFSRFIFFRSATITHWTHRSWHFRWARVHDSAFRVTQKKLKIEFSFFFFSFFLVNAFHALYVSHAHLFHHYKLLYILAVFFLS